MGYTMDIIKMAREMRKINKHLKKNKKLKEHFDAWLEETYKTESEAELMKMIREDNSIVIEIIAHYEKVIDDYK